MPCKICGKPFNPKDRTTASALTFKVKPQCKCGKVRKRVRKEGCPECGSHGLIQLDKRVFGWHAYCPDCKHEWRVFK